jgi:branched-chain amino acid transport system substrate-binding protein
LTQNPTLDAVKTSSVRLGVLPPGSNAVPLLAADIVAALRYGCSESGLDVELVTEFAGYNADPRLVLPKVQQLLVGEGVACVVAPLNVSLIGKLAGEFETSGVPLVVLSLGEDPLFDSARNPHVFVNDFHLWRAAWMCGYVGARRFGPAAASLVSLHEAGYGLNFAFQLGLEAAGGHLLQTAVTHRHTTTDDPLTAIADIAGRKPDFVWAGYSGREAISFLPAWAAAGVRDRIPLIGLPPLVDDHVRRKVGDAMAGAYIVTPGAASDHSADAAAGLVRALGRRPHPYAVLAYEAAHLMAAAARTGGSTAAGLLAHLGAASFHGPRGQVRFDDGSVVDQPFHLTRIAADAVSEDLEGPPLLGEQHLLARRQLAKQGWINPYLCA